MVRIISDNPERAKRLNPDMEVVDRETGEVYDGGSSGGGNGEKSKLQEFKEQEPGTQRDIIEAAGGFVDVGGGKVAIIEGDRVRIRSETEQQRRSIEAAGMIDSGRITAAEEQLVGQGRAVSSAGLEETTITEEALRGKAEAGLSERQLAGATRQAREFMAQAPGTQRRVLEEVGPSGVVLGMGRGITGTTEERVTGPGGIEVVPSEQVDMETQRDIFAREQVAREEIARFKAAEQIREKLPGAEEGKQFVIEETDAGFRPQFTEAGASELFEQKLASMGLEELKAGSDFMAVATEGGGFEFELTEQGRETVQSAEQQFFSRDTGGGEVPVPEDLEKTFDLSDIPVIGDALVGDEEEITAVEEFLVKRGRLRGGEFVFTEFTGEEQQQLEGRETGFLDEEAAAASRFWQDRIAPPLEERLTESLATDLAGTITSTGGRLRERETGEFLAEDETREMFRDVARREAGLVTRLTDPGLLTEELVSKGETAVFIAEPLVEGDGLGEAEARAGAAVSEIGVEMAKAGEMAVEQPVGTILGIGVGAAAFSSLFGVERLALGRPGPVTRGVNLPEEVAIGAGRRVPSGMRRVRARVEAERPVLFSEVEVLGEWTPGEVSPGVELPSGEFLPEARLEQRLRRPSLVRRVLLGEETEKKIVAVKGEEFRLMGPFGTVGPARSEVVTELEPSTEFEEGEGLTEIEQEMERQRRITEAVQQQRQRRDEVLDFESDVEPEFEVGVESFLMGTGFELTGMERVGAEVAPELDLGLEQGAEVLVETLLEVPTELGMETPIEVPVETPMETPLEVPTETRFPENEDIDFGEEEEELLLSLEEEEFINPIMSVEQLLGRNGVL